MHTEPAIISDVHKRRNYGYLVDLSVLLYESCAEIDGSGVFLKVWKKLRL